MKNMGAEHFLELHCQCFNWLIFTAQCVTICLALFKKSPEMLRRSYSSDLYNDKHNAVCKGLSVQKTFCALSHVVLKNTFTILKTTIRYAFEEWHSLFAVIIPVNMGQTSKRFKWWATERKKRLQLSMLVTLGE